MPTTLHTSDLPGLTLLHRGKVRDIYDLPGNRLLMVATDRLSAFDRILATRFGVAAVDLVLEKKFGRMVALQGNRIVDVDM